MLKEWVPENGNLVSEGSIPLIGGTAWKLLTAADEGRGLVQWSIIWSAILCGVKERPYEHWAGFVPVILRIKTRWSQRLQEGKQVWSRFPNRVARGLKSGAFPECLHGLAF